MNTLLERFLRYVKIDTTASEETGTIPSFSGEWDLAHLLKNEMLEMGIEDAEVTEHCFVFGTIPASPGCEDAKTIGLLAHLDTAPDCIGKDVKPKVHEAYKGGGIKLDNGLVIDPAVYPELETYIGDDIVVSDGTTLLGADDKAGVAIVMDVASKLMEDSSIKHGKIRIAFTPDEEISVGGASIFDVEKFGADFGITVDGDGIGELNYETFHAYAYTVKIRGTNIHTGEAKGKLVNACTIAREFDQLLPQRERPEYTEGYEGFMHLYEMKADVDYAELQYLLRDFDKEDLESRKKVFQNTAQALNEKYGQERVALIGEHEYTNPKEVILAVDGLTDVFKKAFRECNVEPVIKPIRGGTDGSTLAEKGLACPNLFLGGHNYHSCKEFVSVNAMGKSAEVLIRILSLFS